MTINDIREKKFDTTKRGYQPEEVDNFLNELTVQLQSTENEKADLIKKMEVLANRIDEYKKDEESIQDALLGAQKLGKRVLTEAKEQAETLTKESEEKSEQMVTMARAEADKLVNDAKAVAQDLLLKSKAESKRMISDAQQNVDTIIRNTKYDIEKEQHNLVRVQKEVSAFKASLLDMYRGHIDLIKNLPEVEYEEANNTRDIKKSIYDQKAAEETTKKEIELKEETSEVAETPKTEEVSENTEATEAKAEVAKNELTENEKKIIERAKKDVLQDTVEIAKEHYVKRFSELKFGGNANNNNK